MKRRIALAMAVSMLITSIPVNSITGFAEEAVIVEDVIVEQANESERSDSDTFLDVADAVIAEEVIVDSSDEVTIEGIEVLEDSLAFDSVDDSKIEDVLADSVNESESDGCNHSYPDAWEVHTPAGCETDGVEIRKCVNCDSTETRLIPAGHTYGEELTTETDTHIKVYKICSVCSDEKVVSLTAKMDKWEDTTVELWVEPGEDVTLSADSVFGDTTGLYLSWYMMNENDEYINLEHSGSTYVINDIAHNGNYDCSVYDGENHVKINYLIYIDSGLEPGEITEHYATSTGSDFTIDPKITVPEETHLTYEWTAYNWNDMTPFVMEDPSAESFTITCDSSKYFMCTVSDQYGNKRYLRIYISVSDPYLNLIYDYDHKLVDPGAYETFEIKEVQTNCPNTEDITYQWYRLFNYATGKEENILLEGATSATYATNIVGQYLCKVSLNGITEEATFSVDYGTYPDIEYDYVPFYDLKPGSTVTMWASVLNHNVQNVEAIEYQWYTRGEYDPITYDYVRTAIEGANESTYVTDTPGLYSCELIIGVASRMCDIEVNCTHSYPDTWEVKTAATCTEPGENYRKCIACDSVETKTIAAKGHSFGEELTSETDTEIRIYKVCAVCFEEETISITNKGDIPEVSVGSTERFIDAIVGEVITLDPEASISDGSALNYSWTANEWCSNDDASIEVATPNAAVLTISCNVKSYYTCTVSDKYGNEKQVTFYISVYNPYIILEHEYENAVLPGAYATLAFTNIETNCSNPENIQYQWYSMKYDMNLDDYVESIIEGATASTYVTNIPGLYDCKVTIGDFTETASFYVTNNATPYINLSYESELTVEIGNKVELGFDDISTNVQNYDEMKFQWYRLEYDEEDEEVWVIIPEATASTYETMISGEYACEVSINNEAVGEIFSKAYFYVEYSGDLRPQDTIVLESYDYDINLLMNYGQDVILDTKVKDYIGTLSYQWYKLTGYDDEDNEIYELIQDQTGATLNLGILDERLNDTYKCVVGNEFISKSVYYYVSVGSGLQIFPQSSYTGNIVKPGESISLAVKATSEISDAFEFTWYYYDEVSEKNIEIPGAVQEGNMSTLTFVPEKSMVVSYKVTDKYTESYYGYYVYVDSGFEVDNSSEGRNFSGELGTTIPIYVNAVSDYPERLTYQWYECDDEMLPITGATSDTYMVTVDSAEKVYYCEISDGYNTAGVYSYVTPVQKLTAEADQLIFTVEEGEDVVLKVNAATDPSYGTIQYRWEYDDMTVAQDTNTFTVEDVTEAMVYYCYVSDDYHSIKITFAIGMDGDFDNSALDFATAVEIKSGEIKTAYIPMDGLSMFFKFTPDQSGYYFIYSDHDDGADTFVDLYDENGMHLADDDDGNYDRNFGLNYEFEAGKTYYIEAHYYDRDSGMYPVGVNYIGCCLDSDYGEGIITKVASCTEDGEITYICSGCGEIKTTVVVAKGHSYGDEIFESETDTIIRKYKKCAACDMEETDSIEVKEAEQTIIEDAQSAMSELKASTDEIVNVSDAVSAVTNMDNQTLIEIKEISEEGSDTAMNYVTDLENVLLKNKNADIVGSIGTTTAKEGTKEEPTVTENVAVAGAAVTVAKALLEAEGSSDETKKPDENSTYSAQLEVKEVASDNTEPGVYTVDISLNVIETDNQGNTSEFATDIQPAAPIYITIPVPESIWNSKFVLEHVTENGIVKVNYVRNSNMTISFYAASLSEWMLNVTSCGEHDYVLNEEASIAATCEEIGKNVSVCEVCGDTITEVVSKLGHKFSASYTVDREATCTVSGRESRHCERCTAATDSRVIPSKGGHTWTTIVDKAANCGTAGSQHRECTAEGCGTKEPATTIPATGKHNWKTVIDKAATCGTAGSQHKECSVCKTKQAATSISATGKHSYGSYTVTTAPTIFKTGWQTAKCKNCTATTGKAVAKLAATITLKSSALKLQVKKSATLTSLVTGLAKGDSIKSWTSSDVKVATITNAGKVTGKKAGKANITVTLASGKTATIALTVQKAAVATTKVSVASTNLTLSVGKSQTLTPVIEPITSLQKATYKTSNKKIVTVTSKGKITAKKPGTATITVKSGKKSVKVKVIVPAPELKAITKVPAAKTLKKGKSFTIKPVLSPNGATAKITYSSSDTSIATVNAKGKVVAKKKPGTAVITVKAGKFTATCKVTVK